MIVFYLSVPHIHTTNPSLLLTSIIDPEVFRTIWSCHSFSFFLVCGIKKSTKSFNLQSSSMFIFHFILHFLIPSHARKFSYINPMQKNEKRNLFFFANKVQSYCKLQLNVFRCVRLSFGSGGVAFFGVFYSVICAE